MGVYELCVGVNTVCYGLGIRLAEVFFGEKWLVGIVDAKTDADQGIEYLWWTSGDDGVQGHLIGFRWRRGRPCRWGNHSVNQSVFWTLEPLAAGREFFEECLNVLEDGFNLYTHFRTSILWGWCYGQRLVDLLLWRSVAEWHHCICVIRDCVDCFKPRPCTFGRIRRTPLELREVLKKLGTQNYIVSHGLPVDLDLPMKFANSNLGRKWPERCPIRTLQGVTIIHLGQGVGRQDRTRARARQLDH